jgi:hypothetical protein
MSIASTEAMRRVATIWISLLLDKDGSRFKMLSSGCHVQDFRIDG